MIKDRNLTPGTVLVGHYKKAEYACEVMASEKGRALYRLMIDGREFKSLSAAGTAITGGACNGWAFWSLERAQEAKAAETQPGESITPETNLPPETEPTQEVETKPGEVQKTGTYRMKNQKGTLDGQSRWFCYDCAEPFLAPAGEKHAACPKKHQK